VIDSSFDSGQRDRLFQLEFRATRLSGGKTIAG